MARPPGDGFDLDDTAIGSNRKVFKELALAIAKIPNNELENSEAGRRR